MDVTNLFVVVLGAYCFAPASAGGLPCTGPMSLDIDFCDSEICVDPKLLAKVTGPGVSKSTPMAPTDVFLYIQDSQFNTVNIINAPLYGVAKTTEISLQGPLAKITAVVINFFMDEINVKNEALVGILTAARKSDAPGIEKAFNTFQTKTLANLQKAVTQLQTISLTVKVSSPKLPFSPYLVEYLAELIPGAFFNNNKALSQALLQILYNIYVQFKVNDQFILQTIALESTVTQGFLTVTALLLGFFDANNYIFGQILFLNGAGDNVSPAILFISLNSAAGIIGALANLFTVILNALKTGLITEVVLLNVFAE